MPTRTVQSSINTCAREVLEVVPLVMREIRKEMREHSARELSVPQFRTLHYLSRHKCASLSEVAEHIGLTLPSMSTLIDGLVVRNFAIRRTHPDDRRRMTLELTAHGEVVLFSAREATQTYLAKLLGPLSPADHRTIIKAMRTLKSIFTQR
jgi:DNA-binding MarR family transcriptional regulator